MEAATLERLLLSQALNRMVIDHVGNDQDLPNLLQKQISPQPLKRPFLLDFARTKIDGLP